MMKKTCILTILAGVLAFVVLTAVGCGQPGETTAKGHRRHIRNARINQQELNRDIDTVLLFDKPSKLTDKKIPPEIDK